MSNLILIIGQFKITPLYWGFLIAFIFSSFSMWRRLLKEDYFSEEIFTTNILMILSAVFFEIVIWKLAGVRILGAFFGSILIVFWRFKAQNKNVWEGLDCLALPILFFMFFGGLGSYVAEWQIQNLFYVILALFGFGLYFFFKKRYRRLTWYKSGKVGFLFCLIYLYCSLGLLVLDFWQKKGIYLPVILWALLFTAGIVIFVNRAKRN